jgi:spermidine synthase
VTDVRWGEDDGQRVLLVDGVVQSVDGLPSDGYWLELLPDKRPKRSLILGLGAATIANLLHARFGEVRGVAVDDDPRVIELAREPLARFPELAVVESDALDFVARCGDSFDYVCVDLYRGAEMDICMLQRPFLRALRRILDVGGTAVFNLTHDRRLAKRLARLERIFTVASSIRVDDNVVVRVR